MCIHKLVLTEKHVILGLGRRRAGLVGVGQGIGVDVNPKLRCPFIQKIDLSSHCCVSITVLGTRNTDLDEADMGLFQ